MISVFRDAYCLSGPVGHSWGGSDLLCTAGSVAVCPICVERWHMGGERYLEEGYLTEVTDPEAPTDPYGFENLNHNHGYGYQLWGNSHGVMQNFLALHRHILAHLGDLLPEDPKAKAELDTYLSGQKLFCLPKSPISSMAKKIRGRTFVCMENPMDLQWFRLAFAGDEGSLTYENQQREDAFLWLGPKCVC